MARTLILNGKVISSAGGVDQDVLIDGETVAALGAPGFFSEEGNDMELPFGGTFASDTFETGTRAAACGGVTTLVGFALQRTGEDVQAGLPEWHRKAEGECAIDYGVHQINETLQTWGEKVIPSIADIMPARS